MHIIITVKPPCCDVIALALVKYLTSVTADLTVTDMKPALTENVIGEVQS